MSDPDILYPAIFVFSMLLIGLVLTIREFSRLQAAENRQMQERRASSEAHEDADSTVRRASGF
jgi:flagellar biosynthesis/type III secretory pathway M-ring protein FliF/YscJ